jgi:hypothetical protein
MLLALIIQNPTAQTIYALLRKYWFIAGLVILMIDVIVKVANKIKKKNPANVKTSILVGETEVIRGVTTPRVFNGSTYRVAYETMVQESEIPFITCELRSADNDRYVGDLIFETSDTIVSEKELQSMPISEVHLGN